jgi:peptidoglycan hydrolase-like protein with peptidoglycan-binding domain
MGSKIGDLIAVISNNSSDVIEVVDKLGGVGSLLRAAPAIYRIVNTISERNKDPVEELEQAERTLYYGEQTRTKIKAFQQKHGLEVDGIVGNQTWAKVEELIKEK